MAFAYVCGDIVPIEEAKISISDRGLLYGDGLFETIRVINSQCVRFSRHMDRLHAGSHILGFGDSLNKIDFEAAIASILDANNLADARVRLTVTRGASAGPGRLGSSSEKATIIITADPLAQTAPEPARIIISSIRRDENSPLSRVKSLNYLPSILARIEAEQSGVDDAILLNNRGGVSDGVVGNVFMVKGKKLMTPPLDEGPLPGTVRAAIIHLAPELGLEAVETAIDPIQLHDADELFFTNAIQLVRPICELSGKKVGTGRFASELLHTLSFRT